MILTLTEASFESVIVMRYVSRMFVMSACFLFLKICLLFFELESCDFDIY